MADVRVVVGSVYGTAKDVAHVCVEQLLSQGHRPVLLGEADYEQLIDDALDVVLVVTSTTGDGEIPEGVLPLYEALEQQLPVLPAVRFGVIALGDSGYEHFAQAGIEFISVLHKTQATAVCEPLFIDACETADPEEAAVRWLGEWAELL